MRCYRYLKKKNFFVDLSPFSKANYIDTIRASAVTRDKFRAWHKMVIGKLKEYNISEAENVWNGDESAMMMKDNAKFVHTEAPYALKSSGLLIILFIGRDGAIAYCFHFPLPRF